MNKNNVTELTNKPLTETSSTTGILKRIPANYLGLVSAIIGISIFLTIASPYFLNVTNFINIGNQIAINIIIATGMTIIICSGGIDLSVGSNVALTGVLIAIFFRATEPGPFQVITGLMIGVGAGVLIGLMNGFFIAVLDIPPFITTLGTMGVLRGLALVFSGGRPLMGLPAGFQALVSGFVLGIPKSVIVAVLCVVAGAFLLNRTVLGRYARAIGGNERCVVVSGIHLTKYKIFIYTIGSVMTAVSGIALTSIMATAEPIAGNLYELDAIAVVVMGGTVLEGGKGSILGTVLGAVLLGVARNGLNIMGVPANYHQLLVGIIILVAVIAGSSRTSR